MSPEIVLSLLQSHEKKNKIENYNAGSYLLLTVAPPLFDAAFLFCKTIHINIHTIIKMAYLDLFNIKLKSVIKTLKLYSLDTVLK